jgi:predicted unusual protein kinase regulating ubiquinone biosynthesis (AarF/ABC1/UbiB family)
MLRPRSGFATLARLRLLAALVLAGFAGGTPVLADPDPQAPASPEDGLLAAVVNSYAVFSSDVPWSVKAAEIDSLFEQLEVACTPEACSRVQRALTELNDNTLKKGVEDVFAQAPKGLPGSVDARFKATEAALLQRSQEIRQLLWRIKPDEVAPKLVATLQLLRYVHQVLEERAAADPSGGELRREVEQVARQGRSLYKIYGVVKAHGGSTSSYTTEEIRTIVRAINDLGFFYIKLAQSVSNASFLVDGELGAALREFQDAVEPMPPEVVERVIRTEFGVPASELFEGFDAAKPIATGTIAQTYRVKGKGKLAGKTLVVKVQRPGLQERLDANSRTNQILFRALKIGIPEGYTPLLNLFTSAIVGMEEQFARELDFTNEARALERFRAAFALTPGVTVPRVYHELSGGTVMTMASIDGRNIAHFADDALKAGPASGDGTAESERAVVEAERLRVRKRLFSILLDALLYQTFVTGELHADMHPGNVLAYDKWVGLIDFGNVLRTRGIMTKPVRLFYYLYAGQADNFARAFASMGAADSGFPVEEFTQRVQSLMDEKRHTRITYKGVFKEDPLDRFVDSVEILGKAIAVAVGDHRFAIDAGYFQLLRTMVPGFGTLGRLAQTIPPGDFKKLLLGKLVTFPPMALGRYALTRPLALFYKTRDYIRSFRPRLVPNACETAGDLATSP